MKLLTTLILGIFLGSSFAAASLQDLGELKGPFSLPSLPYPANALAVSVDEETMKIHHGKHHQAYVDNLNKALGSEKANLKTLFKTMSRRSDVIRNNAGGHWNHSFFWTIMTPEAEKQKVPEELQKEIDAAFGSMDKFKEEFEKQGATLFGSGWVWLIRNLKGKLEITTTSNQDNPLMNVAKTKGIPIFGADVWEHAYYIKYQNKRADYLKNFWKIVNWERVNLYNTEAKSLKY